jgi:hypothetical protein
MRMDRSEYRKYSVDELKLADEDLQMNLTMGMVICGTWIDLLRLKKYILELPDFRVNYNTISSTHLRIVKINEWDEYVEWKKQRNNPT